MLNQPGNRMEVFNWDAIYQTPQFTEAISEFQQLAIKSKEFYSDVSQQSRRVLQREANGKPISDESLAIAVNYLFEEFAAIVAIGKISFSPVDYAHYSDWIPYQRYINGDYDGVAKELGFIKYDLPAD